MATEVHVAGLQLTVHDRYLMQRCGWCGAVLLSYDLWNIAMPGEWKEPSLFEVGKLVRFTYDGTVARWGEVALGRTIMEPLDLEKLPDDACTEFIPFESGE